MKFMKGLLFALILTGCSTCLLAQTGPYVQGQAGVYGMDFENKAFKNIFDYDGTKYFTGRVGVGYLWQASERLNFGLEGATNIFKRHTIYEKSLQREQNFVEHDRSSIDLMVVAECYASDRFDMFLKGGAAYVSHTKLIYMPYLFNHLIETNHKKITPKAGFGFGYDLTKTINANVSLNHEFYHDNIIPSATSLLLGVRYAPFSKPQA